MNWLSFTAKNDVVDVALVVTLAVLGILFASLFWPTGWDESRAKSEGTI